MARLLPHILHFLLAVLFQLFGNSFRSNRSHVLYNGMLEPRKVVPLDDIDVRLVEEETATFLDIRNLSKIHVLMNVNISSLSEETVGSIVIPLIVLWMRVLLQSTLSLVAHEHAARVSTFASA